MDSDFWASRILVAWNPSRVPMGVGSVVGAAFLACAWDRCLGGVELNWAPFVEPIRTKGLEPSRTINMNKVKSAIKTNTPRLTRSFIAPPS